MEPQYSVLLITSPRKEWNTVQLHAPLVAAEQMGLSQPRFPSSRHTIFVSFQWEEKIMVPPQLCCTIETTRSASMRHASYISTSAVPLPLCCLLMKKPFHVSPSPVYIELTPQISLLISISPGNNFVNLKNRKIWFQLFCVFLFSLTQLSLLFFLKLIVETRALTHPQPLEA